MCYYSLAQDFSKFLNDKPLEATRAMVKAVYAIVEREELVKYRFVDGKISNFKFFEITSKYLQDNSFFWDEDDFNRERKKILSSFDDYILEISKDSEWNKLLLDLIKEIAKINKIAVIWRRLLTTAKKNPSVFVPILYPLAIERMH